MSEMTRPSDGDTVYEDCPACFTTIDMTGVPAFSDVTCPTCGHAIKACSLFNHYQITALLGEGGMGSVFRAIDTRLEREVALKILKISSADVAAESEKLAREARATALINHPHVIRIYDFGHARGQFYIAMELLPGGSLDDRMQALGRVPELEVLQTGLQVAEGLKAALAEGLIHRDIKPANILFADRHTVKLVDFGLAMALADAENHRGEIWGTPFYIAPEKLDELPEDFRSDIYSLGGSLFHAMAGRPPYDAENATLVALKQLKSRPVSLQAFAPDVGTETAYVINRMMSKKPAERYTSYDELIGHLGFAIDKVQALARGEAPVEDVRDLGEARAGWTSWIGLVLPAAVLLGLGVLGFLYFFTALFQKTP